MSNNFSGERSIGTDENTQDIFDFKSLSLSILQNEILGIGVSSKFLIIANKKMEVFRWVFEQTESLRIAYTIPAVDKEKEKINTCKIFCDQKGNHIIIRYNRLYYYFNLKLQSIKMLTKLNLLNVLVTSVGFDESAGENNSNIILLGTEPGIIYGYNIEYEPKPDKVSEKITEYLNLKKENNPIYGISYETYPEKKVAYVIATTNSRIYQFVGVNNLEQLFTKYRESDKDKEFQRYLDNTWKNFPIGDINKSMMQMLYRKDGSFYSFGWMTSVGFCFGNYSQDPVEKSVSKFVIIPYAKLKDGAVDLEESPICVAHSEYHVYLLFSDCISVLSKITSNIVFTENLYDSDIKEMYYDRTNSCLFLHSSKALYQLRITSESRDVWKAYLEMGDYENAINHCKQKGHTTYLKRVNRLYASNLYSKGDYVKSANFYGQSDERFEEVSLKFLVKNQFDALKVYLNSVDGNLPAKTSLTQKTLIATWLTEIYLHELNTVVNPNLNRGVKDKFKSFINANVEYLDTQTIYQLLHNYGRTQEFLEFAELKNDYETVILYYVNDKQFIEAINKLHNFIKLENNKGGSSKKDNNSPLFNIFLKFAHVFMKFQPELTITKLLKHYQHCIDTHKILSALMNTEEAQREKVSDFLEELIEKHKNKNKNIHNLYVFFLSQLNSDEALKKLIYYLQSTLETKVVYFEVDYAIKVFNQFKKFSALALAFAIMGKHDDAVKLSLENRCPEIAKKIAKQVDDPKTKRLLWIEILKTLIKEEFEERQNNEDSNISFALQIMGESEILKIEDVLPNLLGNIKIEVFKREISDCINSYEKSIVTLNSKIQSYNEASKNIREDISKVKKKYMEIQYQQCICEICNNIIKEEDIFVFPCGHIFDSNCIISQIQYYSCFLENLQPKVEKLLIFKTEIEIYERQKNELSLSHGVNEKDEKDDKGKFFNLLGFGEEGKNKPQTPLKRAGISGEDMRKLEDMKVVFSSILTDECVLCGDIIIDSIKQEFVSTDNEKNSWSII